MQMAKSQFTLACRHLESGSKHRVLSISAALKRVFITGLYRHSIVPSQVFGPRTVLRVINSSHAFFQSCRLFLCLLSVAQGNLDFVKVNRFLMV